jgi:hypothetical protein
MLTIVVPKSVVWRERVIVGTVGAALSRPTLLAGGILLIVGLGADKQMIRSHAGGSVAVVAHVASRRDRSVSQFPRQSVSKYLPLRVHHSELTVAAPVAFRYPEPAGVGLTHLLPEALGEWSRLGGHAQKVTP